MSLPLSGSGLDVVSIEKNTIEFPRLHFYETALARSACHLFAVDEVLLNRHISVKVQFLTFYFLVILYLHPRISTCRPFYQNTTVSRSPLKDKVKL